MKSIIGLSLFLMSFSVFSAIELYGKNLNKECTIINDTVTKKMSFQKGAAGFTSSSTIKSFGTQALVAKALESATGRTMTHLGMEYHIKVDSKTTLLFPDDSVEAASLIKFINSACF